MISFRSISTVACALGLASLQGCGSTSWIRQRPSDDDRFRYYVGRAFSAKSVATGIEVARADARSRVVEENFGSQIRFQRDTLESLDAAQVVERSRAVSKVVHLEGFEEIGVSHEEIEEGLFNAAVLFRYPKDAIAKEKERLMSIPQPEVDFAFAAAGMESSPRAPDRSHKSVNATFVFGAGVGGQAATMTDVDNAAASVRLQGEWRVSRAVGLNAVVDVGANKMTYSNGALELKKSMIGLGLPFYWSRVDRSSWTPFLEPVVQAVRSEFSFVEPSGRVTSSTSKWQFGPGVNVGLQVRFFSTEGSGLSVRPQVGVFFPTSDGGVNSSAAVQGGLMLQWELFK